MEQQNPLTLSFTVISQFNQCVSRFSQATAMIWEEENVWRPLSYLALQQKAQQLAQKFLTQYKLNPGDCVAISMPRSPHYLIVALACWYGGLIYTPLPHDWQAENIDETLLGIKSRLGKIAATEKVQAIFLTTQHLQQTIIRQQADFPKFLQTLCIRSVLWEEFTAGSVFLEQTFPSYSLAATASLFSSSGTTGEPKFIAVPHSGIVDRVQGHLDLLPKGEKNVLGFAGFDFDASLMEALLAWFSGGCYFFIAENIRQQFLSQLPEIFVRSLTINLPINTVILLPRILRELSPAQFPSISHIITMGESCELNTLAPWFERATKHPLTILNGYGPTETTFGATLTPIYFNQPVTISHPMPGIDLYFYDETDQQWHCIASRTGKKTIPLDKFADKEGELGIGGNGIAHYWQNATKNAEKFSLLDGARIYHSADLIRIDREGNLHYLYRLDRILKHNGKQVKLDQVEHRLKQCPLIQEAIVIGKADVLLIGLLVNQAETPYIRNQCADWLAQQHFNPEFQKIYFTLTQVQLNKNGKIDRRPQTLRSAQPQYLPLPPKNCTPSSPAENDTYQILQNIWQEVLGSVQHPVSTLVQEILGIDIPIVIANTHYYANEDDFFACGGDSFNANLLIQKICDHFCQNETRLSSFLNTYLRHYAKFGEMVAFLNGYFYPLAIKKINAASENIPLYYLNTATEIPEIFFTAITAIPYSLYLVNINPGIQQDSPLAFMQGLAVSLFLSLRELKQSQPGYWVVEETPWMKMFFSLLMPLLSDNAILQILVLNPKTTDWQIPRATVRLCVGHDSDKLRQILIEEYTQLLRQQVINKLQRYHQRVWQQKEVTWTSKNIDEASPSLPSSATLWIHGVAGSGKTWLLQNLWQQTSQKKMTIYISLAGMNLTVTTWETQFQQTLGLNDAEWRIVMSEAQQQGICWLLDDDSRQARLDHPDIANFLRQNIKLSTVEKVQVMIASREPRLVNVTRSCYPQSISCYQISSSVAEKENISSLVPITFWQAIAGFSSAKNTLLAQSYLPLQFCQQTSQKEFENTTAYRYAWLQFLFRYETAKYPETKTFEFNEFLMVLKAFFTETVPVATENYWQSVQAKFFLSGEMTAPHFVWQQSPFFSLLNLFCEQDTGKVLGLWQKTFSQEYATYQQWWATENACAIESPATFPPLLVSPLTSEEQNSCVALAVYPESRPIFLCYPLTGDIPYYYRQWVDTLFHRQSCYALQMKNPADFTTDISQRLQYAIKLMRKIQPYGPYQLIGWSFGAVFAYHLALALEQIGQSVAFVINIDGISPACISQVTFTDRLQDMITVLAKDIYKVRTPENFSHQLQQQVSRLSGLAQTQIIISLMAYTKQLLAPLAEPATQTKLTKFFQALQACEANFILYYQFPDYPRPQLLRAPLITFEAATEVSLARCISKQADFQRWKHYVTSGQWIYYRIAYADHFNIFYDPEFKKNFQKTLVYYQRPFYFRSLQEQLWALTTRATFSSLTTWISPHWHSPQQPWQEISPDIALSQFLAQPSIEILLLQGPAGVGKSCWLQKVYENYRQAWHAQPSVENWFPLWVSARTSPEQWLSETLWHLGLSKEQIASDPTLHQQAWLLLLDDYSLQQIATWKKDWRFASVWQKVKIIISSRAASNAASLSATQLPYNIICWHLKSFSENQIRTYFDNAGVNLRQQQQWLKQSPSMRSLLHNPLILKLFIATMSQQQDFRALSRADLYQQFLQRLNQQMYQKLGVEKGWPSTLNENVFHQEQQAYTNLLAYALWQTPQEIPSFLYEDKYYLTEYLQAASHVRVESFMDGTPRQIYFLHPTFIEHFVAQILLQSLLQPLEKKSLSLWENIPPARLQQGLVTTFLKEQWLQLSSSLQNKIATRLWECIFDSRYRQPTAITEKKCQYAAANAITFLVKIGVALSGKDLSAIRICGADLSGALCHYTNFSGADLREVLFSHADLRYANLRDAKLEAANFGEYLHDGQVQCCAIDGTGKWLIAGNSDGSVSLWEIAGAKLHRRWHDQTQRLLAIQWIASECFAVVNENGDLLAYDIKNNFAQKKYTLFPEELSAYRSGKIISAYFSSPLSGSSLLVVSDDRYHLSIWQQIQEEWRLKIDFALTKAVKACAIDHQACAIVVADTHALYQFSLTEKKLSHQRILAKNSIIALLSMPNGIIALNRYGQFHRYVPTAQATFSEELLYSAKNTTSFIQLLSIDDEQFMAITTHGKLYRFSCLQGGGYLSSTQLQHPFLSEGLQMLHQHPQLPLLFCLNWKGQIFTLSYTRTEKTFFYAKKNAQIIAVNNSLSVVHTQNGTIEAKIALPYRRKLALFYGDGENRSLFQTLHFNANIRQVTFRQAEGQLWLNILTADQMQCGFILQSHPSFIPGQFINITSNTDYPVSYYYGALLPLPLLNEIPSWIGLLRHGATLDRLPEHEIYFTKPYAWQTSPYPLMRILRLTEKNPRRLVYLLSVQYQLARVLQLAVSHALLKPLLIKSHSRKELQALFPQANITQLWRLYAFLACHRYCYQVGDMLSATEFTYALTKIDPMQIPTQETWERMGDLLGLLENPSCQDEWQTWLNNQSLQIEISASEIEWRGTPQAITEELLKLHRLSRAIHTIVENHIVEQWQDNVIYHTEQLATDHHMEPKILGLLLKMLARYGLVKATTDNQWTTTALTPYLQKSPRNNITSLYHTLRLVDTAWWKAAGALDCLLTQVQCPYEFANARSFTSYFQHPRFVEGMACFSIQDDVELAQAIAKGEKPESIVDIAGGKGGLLQALYPYFPDAELILLDLPKVVASHSSSIYQSVGIDLLKPHSKIPSNKSLYIIKGVLHDFNDEDCLTILQRCAKAMGSHSRLLLIERAEPLPNVWDRNYYGDILMLMLFGSQERTTRQWCQLLAKAQLIPSAETSQVIGDFGLLYCRKKIPNLTLLSLADNNQPLSAVTHEMASELKEITLRGDILTLEYWLRQHPGLLRLQLAALLLLASKTSHLFKIYALLQDYALEFPLSIKSLALIKAAQSGLLENVQFWQQQGAELNAQDANGNTALMYACENHHVILVEWLLMQKVQINTKNRLGSTALMKAVEHGATQAGIQEKMITLLLKSGADSTVVNQFGQSVFTLLQRRQANALLKTISFFSTGENLSKTDNVYVDLAKDDTWFEACRSGNLTLVKQCLKEKTDINQQDKRGKTGLLWAVTFGHTNIVAYLCKHRAKINVGDILGTTPLIKATQQENISLLNFLLNNKANVDQQDNHGNTALIKAVTKQNPALVELLLKHHANPEAENQWGQTALIKAVQKNDLFSVTLLLHAGANLTHQDCYQKNAKRYAIEKGLPEMIELLQRKDGKETSFSSALYSPQLFCARTTVMSQPQEAQELQVANLSEIDAGVVSSKNKNF